MKFFLLVGLGGFLGSVLRAAIGQALQDYPIWATLLANLLGAFAIGFLARFLESSANPLFFRAFWMVGFCGGFTTFSAFGLDLFGLLERNQWMGAFLYGGGSVLGTLLFLGLGYRLANWI